MLRGIVSADDILACGLNAFEKASRADLSKPDVIKDTMAFMFETRLVWRPTAHAIESAELQHDYYRCWQGLVKHFDPDRP